VLQFCEAVVKPEHWLPPWAGAGLVHARVRVWVPVPQSLVQELQPPYPDQPPSTGQGCVLQAAVFVAEPGHWAPPHWGTGLVQVRERSLVPPPHVLEHPPKAL
jgi:hypothetical protein